MTSLADDQVYMREALSEARLAFEKDEVPIGCVIVSGDRIIGRGHNLRESDNDPTAHAEIVALRKAAEHLGYWRVTPATLYVTCEPCPMCAGALVNARVDRLVYGCSDPKAGAVDTLYNLCNDSRLNHTMDIQPGVLERECRDILQEFFKKLRRPEG